MRIPNFEQKAAIEHQGGVLLSAGAGSGKTFVLVEHVLHLISEFNSSGDFIDLDDYKLKVRTFLSGIVLVTFTKKAAGELSLRLSKRVKEEVERSERKLKQQWEIVIQSLGSMTVGTIHSYCHKLLSQGYFPEVDPSLNMISATEFAQKIKDLFERWFEGKKRRKGSVLTPLERILVSNERSVVASLVKIFGDPSLRLAWKQMDGSDVGTNNLEEYFDEYFEVAGFSQVYNHNINLGEFEKEKDKQWYSYLRELFDLLENQKLSDKLSYKSYIDLFNKYKGARAPKKDEFVSIKLYFGQLKGFKEFVKKNEKNFLAYFDYCENEFLEWANGFKDVFDYIDKHYDDLPGITFSDLEYLCLRGLESEGAQERVAKAYKYFIVDEFQDTSFVQYSLITKIIRNDFSKLFAVGDIKQAIYGFRGGELGVFKKCQGSVPQNLGLKNNYRSTQNVIQFNNDFFGRLLESGEHYSGQDVHMVKGEPQNYPESKVNEELGDVVCLEVDLNEQESLISVSELCYFEAQALVDRICELQTKFPEQVVSVLYRKLAPSAYLIPLLLEENVGFTAQVKIPLKEDPVLGLFKILLEAYMGYVRQKEKYLPYAMALLETYLEHLKVSIKIPLKTTLQQFFNDIAVMGLSESFKKFLFVVNISNSNYEGNLDLIDSICFSTGDDIESAWMMLDENSGDSFSIDLKYGKNASNVFLMTVHSSKGLEFDHVVLGGIHTNGQVSSKMLYFGNIPGSYKWKVESRQRTPFKSPYYLLEEVLNKGREYFESKRLFYVACTRAVKSLTYVDISSGGKNLSKGSDSWINGFRSCGEGLGLRRIAKDTLLTDEIMDLESLKNKPPLFHLDPLGVEEKTGKRFSLGTFSELSVTRLVSIAECPRKFFISNICGLEVEKLDWLLDETDKNKKVDDSDKSSGTISSVERGTLVHEVISKIIDNDFSTYFIKDELKTFTEEDRQKVEWIIGHLIERNLNFKLISENFIKFSLFGFQVTGIPDLILKPVRDDDFLEVWDFKTGTLDRNKEKAYWFQLYVYGYSCFELGLVNKDKIIKLVLAAVDDKKFKTKEASFKDVCDYLSLQLKNLSSLNSTSGEHCVTCDFDRLCQ